MSPTMHDLRSTLEAVADERGATGTDRLGGVRRHVRRRRTTRLSGGIAALALAVGAVSLMGGTSTKRPVAPAELQNTQNGDSELPRYYSGGELLGETQLMGRVGDTRIITVVPQSWGLTLLSRCSTSANPEVELATEVNGQPFASGTCGNGLGGSTLDGRQFWQRMGVRLGKPMTVRVTVIAPLPGMKLVDKPAVSGERSVVRAGIYGAMPVQDYQFPSRPAVVPRPEGGEYVNGVSLRAQRRVSLPGPTGSWAQTMPYHRDLVAHVVTTAPGMVRVTIRGRLVAVATSWTYGQSEFPMNLDPAALREAGVAVPREGAPVAVRVEVSRFVEAAWDVRIGRRAG